MKIINTKLHGILDYSIMLALTIPWLVNYYTKSGDTWVFAALGGLIGLYSLTTDYEFGLLKLLPMKVHLFFDVFIAIFLIITPWFFQIDHYYFYWPVFLGASILLVAIFSSSKSYIITKNDLDITKP